MSRLPFVSDEPEDPQLREAFERLRKRWGGAPVLHLYRLLGWAPSLLPSWMEFANALRFKTVSPAALRELMIVRSGQVLKAEYEWKHHWVAALEEGVTIEKLESLENWQESMLFDSTERAVLALAEETSKDCGASEATMQSLKAELSNEQVIELVVIACFYAGVGRIINSLEVPLEPGFEVMIPQNDQNSN
jgi:alkylhydroperoxidase family enzyme